jgi:hypothetical protein
MADKEIKTKTFAKYRITETIIWEVRALDKNTAIELCKDGLGNHRHTIWKSRRIKYEE